jgi:anti-sigma factor RsiW
LLEIDADGELDAANALDLERHAEVCPRCAAARERVRELRTTLATAPYFRAPAGLAGDVRAALGLDSDLAPKVERRAAWWRGVAVAASLIIAATLAVATWRFAPRGTAADPLVAELVSAHVRSMMADHLLDVPSSDRHTVKPWFAGRVDFSPAVRDLSPAGFPLAGGRLDYINGRPVAVLVYRRSQHVINCFTWPAAGYSTRGLRSASGYTVLEFTHAGQSWHLVSDASPETLEELARALRETP